MRDKNCFNCSNDHVCVDCVCFNKWQPRPENHKVEPFTLPVEELFAKDRLNTGHKLQVVFNKISETFYRGI